MKLTFTKYGNRAESSFSSSRATRTSCRMPLVIEAGFDEKQGYRSFIQLYEKGKLPEIIFAVTYPVALGIYMAADELGLTIPDDIVVVCFGVGKYNNYLSPAITYMDQPAGEIGSQAFNLLLWKITNIFKV